MWDEIEIVPTRPSDRSSTAKALRELALLVVAAVLAALLPLIG